MIEVKYISSIDCIKEQIKSLLIKYDNEFVPPLSSRSSTRQVEDLSNYTRRLGGIADYYNALIEQEFIVAMREDKLLGFLSFYHNYESKFIKNFSPSNYVSTVIVERGYRRMGIATRMYWELFYNLPLNLRLSYVTTRTWSTNYPHNKLLEKLGFKILTILKDHRGRGIHTIYWGIKIN